MTETSPVPEHAQPAPLLRPGAPLAGKPMQAENGRWYNAYGEKIDPPAERPADNPPRPLNREVLKGIYEKCTRPYEGKYRQALFGVNMEFDTAEIQEVEELVEQAETALSSLKAHFPHYAKLEALLDQMRVKLGTLGENGRLLPDPDAPEVTKELIGGQVPALRVPLPLFYLYQWERKLVAMKEALRQYQRGLARGHSARAFGRDLQELARFVSEVHTAGS
jgi:hypothetical protein